MKSIFTNIQTTVAGVIAVLTGLGLVGGALKSTMEGHFSWEAFGVAFAAIAGGIGLIMAKDGNKSNAPSPTPEAGKVG